MSKCWNCKSGNERGGENVLYQPSAPAALQDYIAEHFDDLFGDRGFDEGILKPYNFGL